ncbi:KAT8 regulatory NSL complex subunit 1-like [Saccoglossus kowalevskii]|uniref:KAT8 regulatory NSL complex subunit 1-like n=1 Tax=Saccoglossus kowalevskii TaxID=10224 RepID=A0ABM0GQS9_SACKO|nr:PREDICTED: KAT8 regulatory NSL complex subunit 1-like [Saccoglossus kowalevskii]
MFSTPVSLRLWCMAAMAPALTEATAQPRSFKLPPTTPTTTDHEGAQASSHDSPDSGHSVDHLTSPLHSQSLVNRRQFIQQNGNSHHHPSTTPRVTSRTLCTNFDPQKLRKNLMGETFKSTIQLVNGNSNSHFSNTMNNNSSKTNTGTVCSTAKFNNLTSLPLSTMSPQTPTTGTPTPSQESLASPGPTTTDVETIDRNDFSDEASVDVNEDTIHTASDDTTLTALSLGISETDEEDVEDEMNTNQNNNPTEVFDSSVISGKSTDSSKKQQHLQKRASLLLKRLRRLQYKQVDGHLQQQLGGLLEQQNQHILAAKEMIKTGSNVDSIDSTSTFDSTTPTLLGLVQQLDKDNTALTNSTLSKKLPNRTTSSHCSLSSPNKKFRREVRDTSNLLKAGVKHLQMEIDSDATEGSSGESCDEEEVVSDNKSHTHVPVHRRALWKWAMDRASVACRWTWLQAQVSDLEYRIRQQTDIYRQIRATKGVISLGEQSPPEDLMKLRTSRLVGRKLSPIEAKIAKLESRNDMSPSNLSTLMSNVDKQTAKINQSLQNFYSPVQKGLPRSPLVNTTVQGKLQSPAPMNGFVDNTASHGNQLLNDSQDSQDSNCMDSASKRLRLEPDRSSPATVSDCGSTAARTRPIRNFRKRKLLRSLGLHQVSRKAQKLSSVRCGCCVPVTPCVMCSGRYNNTQTSDPDVMPLSEKVSLLDYSFHPVLSFPQDIPLAVHYEGLLKSGKWQNRQPTKSPLKKKSHLNHSQQVRKASQKLAKSAAAALLSSAKMRSRTDMKLLSRSHSLPSSVPNTPKNAGSDSRLCRTDVKKRRAAQLAMSKFAMKKNRNRALSLPSNLNNRPPSSLSTPINSIASKDPNLALSASMPGSSLQAYLKKRRGESAFDINNIVIPYSMASSTRVEKLKYKEILTPKWRIIDGDGELAAESKDVGCGASDDEDEEIEDLSDELLTERHAICEVAERKRYLGYVDKNKRGSRGSRTNSGSGTPEPCSPDIGLTENNSLSCGLLPSRADTTPSPSPLNTPHESKLAPPESVRHRTFSTSSEKSNIDRSCSSKSLEMLNDDSEDGFTVIVPPWTERKFPLSDAELAALEGSSPPPSPKIKQEVISADIAESETSSEASTPVLIAPVQKNSRPTTPDFDEDESTDEDVEDLNDPEWTVIKPDTQKKAIVLKLAKR